MEYICKRRPPRGGMYGREETVKIVLQNLTKRYPNRNKKIKEDVIAVNNFNFEIPDGKLIGLLGPSGCGLW